MSLMGSNAVVEQLSSMYSEEVVLDRLGWLYEQQIRRVAEEVASLLLSYRQSVDVATYTREKQTFSGLLDHARKNSLSVQELETLLKHLLEQQKVLMSLVN